MQTLQKLRSQILLQPPQGMTGGRLRISQLRCGVGDIAQFSGPSEQFQIVDIHMRFLSAPDRNVKYCKKYTILGRKPQCEVPTKRCRRGGFPALSPDSGNQERSSTSKPALCKEENIF